MISYLLFLKYTYTLTQVLIIRTQGTMLPVVTVLGENINSWFLFFAETINVIANYRRNRKNYLRLNLQNTVTLNTLVHIRVCELRISS